MRQPPLHQWGFYKDWDCHGQPNGFPRNDIVDWDCHSLTASQWHYYLRLPQSLYSLCKCKTYATQWKNNPSVRLSSDTSLCTKEAAKGDEIPTDINVLCCRKMYTAEWQDDEIAKLRYAPPQWRNRTIPPSCHLFYLRHIVLLSRNRCEVGRWYFEINKNEEKSRLLSSLPLIRWSVVI